MTYATLSEKKPRFTLLENNHRIINLIIHGQGVFIFENKDNNRE